MDPLIGILLLYGAWKTVIQPILEWSSGTASETESPAHEAKPQDELSTASGTRTSGNTQASPSHVFQDSICRICGVSSSAATPFGWTCSPNSGAEEARRRHEDQQRRE